MRWVKSILKWAGIVFAALLVVGAVYQQIGLLLDSHRAPLASQMVSVEGHEIHVVCTGQGNRTFLLDAGAGAWSFEWFRLQPLLAKTGRVCAFDRAGSGWSDATDTGFDGASKSRELAAIVAAANIPRPFVYVGHSLGANFAQIYYTQHPGDIAALVLIEPGMPDDLLEDVHGTRADVMNTSDCTLTCEAAYVASAVGLTRLVSNLAIGHRTLPPDIRADYVAGLSNATSAAATMKYLQSVPKTAYQDLDVKSFGDTPVLIFDSTAPRDPEGNETVADVKVWKRKQLAYFTALAAKSRHGFGPVHVPSANHTTMVMGETQAEFVAKTIGTFLDGAAAAR